MSVGGVQAPCRASRRGSALRPADPASPGPFAVEVVRRPTPAAAALVALAAFTWMLLGATPAFADEFKVGILLDPAMSETTDTTFMEGFQLAVDQSPDVSHPPSVEGGDHLGGMDVSMVVVDDAKGPDELLAAAVDLVERDGVTILIADVSPDVLATIFEPVTGSGTTLIAMSDTGGNEFPATPFFFAAGDRDPMDSLLVARTSGFDDAFVAAYGISPSAAATRGYVAGRLVDLAVEATDRDPSDEQALADGLAGAIGSSPAPKGLEVDPNRTDGAGQPEPESSPGGSPWSLVVVVGVLVVVVIGVAVLGVGALRKRVS